MRSLKTPPALTKDSVYSDWVQDVEMWESFTDVAQAKRGPAVYLSLKGKVRECVRELGKEVIAADDGVKKIIEKLDKLFKQDKVTLQYQAFKEFHKYKRSAGMSMTDFIAHFELLYHRMKQNGLTLPDGIHAMFLLEASNITEEDERLARATITNLTYDDMKEKIIKMFSEAQGSGPSIGSVAPPVKQEPVFQATHEEDVFYSRSGDGGSGGRGSSHGGYFRGRGAARRNWRGGYNYRGGSSFRGGQSGRGGQFSQNGQFNVRYNKDGNVVRCFTCGSLAHMSNKCPHAFKNRDKNVETVDTADKESHITLMSSEPAEEIASLTRETFGMAILDCGCTKTVSGKPWMSAYKDTLSAEDLRSVSHSTDSDVNFRFGDGKVVNSKEIVEIPIVIGNTKARLKVNVVDNDIPLL